MRSTAIIFLLAMLISCGGRLSDMNMEGEKNPEDFTISELKFRIKSDPANPVGYVVLGKTYAEMGKRDQAMAQFERALELSPDYDEARFQKAVLLWDNGELKSAAEIFTKLLARNKSTSYAFKIGKSIGHPFEIKRVTEGMFDFAYPSCSPAGDKLAVQSNQDGNWEIYIIDMPNGNQKRLTNNLARDESPVFAPDGRGIAFTSTRDDTTHVHLEELERNIYMVDFQGTGEIRITDNSKDDWSPAFSPNGRALLFSSDYGADGAMPASPNGSNLYEIYLNDRRIEQITESTGYDISGCYSPAGEEIYFCSDRAGEYDIYRKSLKNKNIERLFEHAGQDAGVRVSKNGKRLVFFSQVEGNFDIYIADLPTKKIQRLTNHSAVDGSPDFSPQGDKIYFHSNRNGIYHIYVINLKTPVSPKELEGVLHSSF